MGVWDFVFESLEIRVWIYGLVLWSLEFGILEFWIWSLIFEILNFGF